MPNQRKLQEVDEVIDKNVKKRCNFVVYDFLI